MALQECKECGKELSSKAECCPHCGAPQKPIKSTSIPIPVRIIGVLVVLFLVIKFPSLIMKDTTKSPLPEETFSSKESYANNLPKTSSNSSSVEKNIALKSVTIKNYKPQMGSLTLIADFTIENDSPYDVKDITITCKHFAKSGTPIDSNTRTIYDLIRAGKSKTFRKFNMGFIHSQADSSSCVITDLKID